VKKETFTGLKGGKIPSGKRKSSADGQCFRKDSKGRSDFEKPIQEKKQTLTLKNNIAKTDATMG